ncbi:MAG: helix-turn-helix transcriptional regulator [Clostridia bacterium]|nr:helix-turn-helix transcriptional regulator [Clostridia bacterium]
MEIDYQVIGQRIKEARKCKCWSQEKLSEELDVTTVYISRVERGSAQINLKRLVQIGSVLNVSIEYLIGGAMPKNHNYLNRELYEILLNCSPDKQRLIYHIAQIVSNAKFV